MSVCGGGHGSPLQYSHLEIPRTEEPGESQSSGSQSVGHGCVTNTHTHTHTSLWLRVRLSVTPRTLARQAPLSMRCSRQEHWGGLPFPPPGGPPDPRIERASPVLAGGLFTTITSWGAPHLAAPTSREHHC